MAKSTPLVTFSVSIAPALLKRIDQAAKHAGFNRSQFMTGAVEAYLDQSEDALKAMANPRVQKAFIGAMTQPGVIRALADALGHDLTESERQQVLAFMGVGKGASK